MQFRKELKEAWGGDDWRRVTLVILIGVVIRFFGLLKDIFMDEAFTYYFSLKPIAFIIGGNDVHPPLHYLIIKPFAYLLGADIYFLRLTSLYFGIMFLLLTYAYVKGKFGKDMAFYALLFLTFNPTIIYYHTELRMYSLLLLLFIFNLIAYDKFLQDRSLKNIILFIIASVLMAYTHIFAGFVILIELIYAFARRIPYREILGTFFMILIYSLPAILLLLNVYRNNPTFHFLQPTWLSLISTYHFMFSLPTTYYYLFWIFIAAVIIFIIKLDIKFEGLGFYGLFLLLPPVIFIMSKFLNIYHHRFMIFMVVPIAILIAHVMDRARKAGNTLDDLLIGIYLLAVFFTIGNSTDPFFEDERMSHIQFTDQNPTYPVVHQYPLSYLPYKMSHNTTRDYLIGEYDFTFCGAAIDPTDKIEVFPPKPYYFVDFSFAYGEPINETITLVV